MGGEENGVTMIKTHCANSQRTNKNEGEKKIKLSVFWIIIFYYSQNRNMQMYALLLCAFFFSYFFSFFLFVLYLSALSAWFPLPFSPCFPYLILFISLSFSFMLLYFSFLSLWLSFYAAIVLCLSKQSGLPILRKPFIIIYYLYYMQQKNRCSLPLEEKV